MKNSKLWIAARVALDDGKWKTAETFYKQILDEDATQIEALDGIADALYAQGRLLDAEIYFRAAVETEPKDLKLRNALARLYIRLEYDQLAIDTLTYVLGQDQKNIEARLLLCDPLRAIGRIDEAHAHAKEALRQGGYKAQYYFYLAGTLRQTLEFSDLDQLRQAADKDVGTAERRLRQRALPGLLADGVDQQGKERLLHISRSLVQQAPSLSAWQRGKKLRIGFVCQEMRTHPVGQYFLPLLQAYQAGFLPDAEFYLYNSGDDLPSDPVYNAIRSSVGDKFRGVKNRAADMIVESVRADRIDILFDLGGHSPRAAAWLFEARLAPVQVLWLGWGHTSGSPGIDYLLADPYCQPADARFISEKLAVIPAPYMILPSLSLPAPGFIPACARNGYVTLGQPNRFDKWTPESIARDAAVMQRLPKSRLLVFRPDAASHPIRKNVLAHFAAYGINAERIEFRANKSADYAACFANVDMMLDPIAVGGGATSMDALRFGVPFFTVPGDQLFQRFSYSFLMYAGLNEFCARDHGDLIEKAVALGSDLPRLAEWRGQRVWQALRQSPLCDLEAYGRSWNAFLPSLLEQEARPDMVLGLETQRAATRKSL